MCDREASNRLYFCFMLPRLLYLIHSVFYKSISAEPVISTG